MRTQGRDGLAADVVLDLAGVGVGDVGVHAQVDKVFLEQPMALVGSLGHGAAGIGQKKVSECVHLDKSPLSEQSDGAADAGLGKAHVLAHVNGSNGRHGL